ncbi:hypothetical protein CAEBREN_22883 [Caenorhabditis brenneri]|uniref:Uncharacterized protein n=1 Tax=Caenorhabditis brenneri TaxID=135651 RepID=G0NX44_CAEBE|nr:hypothetical protein CAEBREN_22883 [Caenorhabditis brenneri]
MTSKEPGTPPALNSSSSEDGEEHGWDSEGEDVGKERQVNPANPIMEELAQPEDGTHEFRAIRQMMELHDIQQKHFMRLTQSHLRTIQERLLLETRQVALLQERSHIILKLLLAQSQKKPVGGRSEAETKLCQACSHRGRHPVDPIQSAIEKPMSLEPTDNQADNPPPV